MTATTSTLLIVSGKGFGPFFSPGWRANATVQVVEGGSAGPFLLTSPAELGDQEPLSALMVNGLEASNVADATLLVVAAHLGDESLKSLIKTQKLLSSVEGELAFSQSWTLSPLVRNKCLEVMRDFVRLGVVQLESQSVFSESVIGLFRSWGVQVEVFSTQ
jgi:hypothetical protein